MTPADLADLEAYQLAHLKRTNALAERKAQAEAEAAEWDAKRTKLCYEATVRHLEQNGLKVGVLS